MMPTTEHDGDMTTIIKWAWRHGAIAAETYETLDDAVSAAHYASEYGEEAVDCIEVVADDGTVTVHDREAVDRLMEPLKRQADEEYRQRPTPTVILDLRAPDGSRSAHESFVEQEKANAAAEKWRALLGTERVKLRPYGRLT